MSTIIPVNTVQTHEGFSLDPLHLVIHFAGSTGSPSLAIPDHLPIKISIHLPDGFMNDFTYSCQYLPVGDSVQVAEQSHHGDSVPVLRLESFPFFPLPLTFNPTESNCWQMLAYRIQCHLVQAVQEDQIYILAREFFWMAFVAAFPAFPFGRCPDWDAKINMSGDFIEYWITDLVLNDLTPESVQRAREFIWDEFKMLATCLLPFSIFPAEH